jgi:hypothetical protein
MMKMRGEHRMKEMEGKGHGMRPGGPPKEAPKP